MRLMKESMLLRTLIYLSCLPSYLIFLHAIFRLAPPLWALGWLECTDQGWRKMPPKEASWRIEKTMEKISPKSLFAWSNSWIFFLMFAMCHKIFRWVCGIGRGCEIIWLDVRCHVERERDVSDGIPSLTIKRVLRQDFNSFRNPNLFFLTQVSPLVQLFPSFSY